MQGEIDRLLACGAEFICQGELQLKHELRLAFSACVTELSQLPQALEEAKRLAGIQRRQSYTDQVLYGGRLALEHSEASQEELERQQLACLHTGDIPSAQRCFQQWIQLEIQSHQDMERLRPQVRKRLEQIHELIGLADCRMDILLAAQEALQHTHKLDEVLIAVERFFEEIQRQQLEPEKLSQDQLAKAVRGYLEINYEKEELGLTLLAAEFDTTENRISKCFQQTYGIGARAYLQRLRIQKAMALLKEGALPVAQVSESVGFVSRRTFDRAFHQLTGKTAAQYRSQEHV